MKSVQETFVKETFPTAFTTKRPKKRFLPFFHAECSLTNPVASETRNKERGERS